ncbi:MAG: VWA domain-containing protein, partial [Pseudomonadota bacterium]
MSTQAPLLFQSREARLGALDALPRTLWLGALTQAQGRLEPRLAALVALRSALVGGRVPPAADWCWPSPELI